MFEANTIENFEYNWQRSRDKNDLAKIIPYTFP